MKTKLLTLTAFAAFIASSASALSFQYDDYRDVDLVNSVLTNAPGANGEDRSSVSGSFDIANDDSDSYAWDKWGFMPGSEIITGAEFVFGFADFTQSVPQYIGNYLFTVDDVSLAGSLGAAGNTVFDLQIVNPVLGMITGDVLLDLNADGVLDWTVQIDNSFAGEVTLYWAVMTADAERVSDSGSTFALLGFSIFSGLLIRRRFKN